MVCTGAVGISAGNGGRAYLFGAEIPTKILFALNTIVTTSKNGPDKLLSESFPAVRCRTMTEKCFQRMNSKFITVS